MESVPEIWAKLLLSADDADRVRSFLVAHGTKEHRIIPKFHITVYYARRRLPLIKEFSEVAEVVLPAVDTRMMLMTPGGEEPRNRNVPVEHTVGCRILKSSRAAKMIQTYRQRISVLETSRILKGRKPSSWNKNAFGARYFQPHMTLVRPGGFGDDHLYDLGDAFRSEIGNLTFNRFEVEFDTFKPTKPGWVKRTESITVTRKCYRCDKDLPVGAIVDIWDSAYYDMAYSLCSDCAN